MLYAVVPQLLNSLHGWFGIWKEIAAKHAAGRRPPFGQPRRALPGSEEPRL